MIRNKKHVKFLNRLLYNSALYKNTFIQEPFHTSALSGEQFHLLPQIYLKIAMVEELYIAGIRKKPWAILHQIRNNNRMLNNQSNQIAYVLSHQL